MRVRLNQHPDPNLQEGSDLVGEIPKWEGFRNAMLSKQKFHRGVEPSVD